MQKIKNLYHLIQSLVANIYYGFPSRKLKVIGVTGTDGKTTTTHLIYHILKSAGKKVSMISSVYANIAGQTHDTGFHVTTPDVFPLQRFLRQSVAAGDEYFVLETTSHALAQNRVSNIHFEAAVVSNITHEHLDFHKSYQDYVKSKAILLKNAKITLLNRDDKSFLFLKNLLEKKYFTYGFRQKTDYHVDPNKKFNLNLTNFNKYNYLAAYALTDLLGLNEQKIITAIKTFKLPQGRLEIVVKKPITVLIDFAHTPNALHEVLSEVKKRLLKSNSRLIHVFGSAGLRDSSKRPLMGKESGKYADIVILTEEDYRTEDPLQIAKQIATGIQEKGFKFIDSNYSNNWNKNLYSIVLDRKKAIETAIEIAKPGDIVILTGKSHEKSLCRDKTEYPWDEKKAVMEAIKKYK
ncbi:UDP-N-acetylmuramyl-tripeptide synthetase [Candidatus Roizmanbacteria bacterium]|nr:UDP-N-acetylmuramyl-tripeptide synthetase [Candidatus Roizmanbacteria bacterium]